MHYFIYFLIISHDKFFYQKSDIRICECCECLNPSLPLCDKSYHNIINILHDPCLGEVSNSKMPGELGKDIALIEEKPVFGKDA